LVLHDCCVVTFALDARTDADELGGGSSAKSIVRLLRFSLVSHCGVSVARNCVSYTRPDPKLRHRVHNQGATIMPKKPREESAAEHSFQGPASESTRQPSAEADEDARIEGFESPEVSEGYSEDVESVPSESALSAIPRALLDVKEAIDKELASTARSGTVQAEDAFAGAANIVGVGIGLGETQAAPGTPALSSGVAPGEYAVNVYVADLTSVDEVKSVIAEAMGESAFSEDSFPLNIIQTGLVEAQPHRFRVRPAPGGVSVAHYKVTAGTIGCLCVGNSAPRNSRLMVLSNNHVLANTNSAVFGDCIAQPGPYDGGKCPADQIAILERFVPISFSAGASNVVDCATGWAWPDRVRRELVYRSGSGLAYFRIASAPVGPYLGMIVGKSGRTTQLTTGRVTGINVTVNVNYGGGRVARFVDQIAIQSTSSVPFSAGGDSGSSIWTWNTTRNPVGLLFAGGGGVTFANRMPRVLAALDVRLYT
jgi:hypothetical protein